MKNKIYQRKRFYVVLLIILYLFLGLINPLKTTSYQISSSKIPSEFDGYRIVQLSDFHCKQFGNDEEKLISLVEKANPDIILLTGDMIDEGHDITNFETLIIGLSSIAPIYYVTGNHDVVSGAPYSLLKVLSEQTGFKILNNETVTLSKGESQIKLTGLDFKSMAKNLKFEVGYADTSYYNLLMYHGSDAFDYLANYNYDLIFSGHVHGGIIRLPFFGGLLGNNGDFFPKYDYGLFYKKNSTLVCNSGMGEAAIPRFYNPREVVVVTLHSETE